ncbi:ATP-binding cassette domain-containing protein [Gordonia oryzae]|uniref:ATP-binding cassette domain-containing protein n=1 Tax=Gordonia oryzae TaxID=2487349 RepID=A0A3N4HF30_9ACTN|nr:ABC transporter ATP-binding protein [Gordonia oryzae]RPA65124.1 ATP-binding cassette domain-containing protein [Gordonia oryzae]
MTATTRWTQVDPPAPGPDVPEADSPDHSGLGWVRRLTVECLRYRRLVMVTLTVTLVAVGVDLVAPLLARTALDRATGIPGWWTIPTIVIVMIGLAIVRYFCQFGRRLTAGRLSISVQNALRLKLFRTLLHLDGATQTEIRTGQVVSRSISDLQIVQGLLSMVPLSAGAAVQVVIALGIMLYLSPLLTMISLAILPMIAVVVLGTRRRLFAATWSAQQAAADVAQHVEETVTGVRVVKGFGQETRAVDELVGLGRDLFAKRLRAGAINAYFTPTMSAIPQLGLVAVIGVGGYLTLNGSITAGTFLAFATYVTTMTTLARLLTNMVVSGQLARAAVERVYDVIDAPTDPDDANTAGLPDGPLGLEFSGVVFGHDDRTVLDGIDLQIAPGECVAVVGPPGSGKTTLADLVSRHRRPDRGSIALLSGPDSSTRHPLSELSADALHSAVGVVFDEPFLYSDTIATNITLGDRPEPSLTPGSGPVAPRVLAAARDADALDFITALPHGFDTVVGERGLTLSGGQRQRVALARALHTAPRLLVLDDATSAVDASTESRILHRLRDRFTDRPTMLVLAHRRSTLMLADRVAVLDEGRIVDVGTVAELEERSPRFRALMSPIQSVADDAAAPLTPTPPHTGNLWPADAPAPEGDWTTRAASAPPAGGTGGRGGRGAGITGALGAMPATPELLASVARLRPADEEPRVDVDAIRVENPHFSLWQILAPVRWLLALAIVAIGVDTLTGLVFPSLARTVIDAATHTDERTLLIATGIGVGTVVLGWFAAAGMTLYSTRAGERVLFGLRVRSYAHLQRLGLDYYERELSGRIMTRMTTDVDALSTFLQTGLSTAIVAVLTLVGVTVAMLFTDLELGALILPVLPVLIVATVVFRRIASRAYTRSRELVSAVNADFQENIAGIKTTQAYRNTAPATRRFTGVTLDWVRARMTSQRAISVYFPFITLCSDLATATTIAVGAHQITTGALSAGTLVAFILYLSLLFGPVQQLSQVFDGYQQAVVGLRRIADLLRTETTVAERDDAIDPEGARFTGDTRLDDVAFRYSGASVDALGGIDLHIPAGTSLALVGRTGAGKSTIVKLLARFYDPTDGVVRMDGTDIRRFTLRGYRRHIGIVPQEPHLFTGTVADNIAYGRPDADHEQIAAAAAAVGASTMIAGLPGGMLHPIGERGAGLSSGQRQLIALARAELVEPDLLLLDEATATLDQATEAMVLAAGDAVTRSRTSVIVAHRLATAARADVIAVVDGGRIVEMGTHNDLLTLGGRYRAFWDAGVDPDADGTEPVDELIG